MLHHPENQEMARQSNQSIAMEKDRHYYYYYYSSSSSDDDALLLQQ